MVGVGCPVPTGGLARRERLRSGVVGDDVGAFSTRFTCTGGRDAMSGSVADFGFDFVFGAFFVFRLLFFLLFTRRSRMTVMVASSRRTRPYNGFRLYRL